MSIQLARAQCLCVWTGDSASKIEGEAPRTAAIQVGHPFSLRIWAQKLIAIAFSDDPLTNHPSDEDDANTCHSKRTSSSRLQLSEPSLEAEGKNGKYLDGLGYLENNADNLLGYLKTVSAHHEHISPCLISHACPAVLLTWMNV